MSIDNNEPQVAEPTVRLCMLRTWPQYFDGYGFNLHAEKSKSSVAANGSTGSGGGLPYSGGQYVGKVDIGSPAESAGLREGDRIVQVDGVDIEGETHSKVVARIKKGSATEADSSAINDPDNLVSRCSLLVVDRRADTYYKEKGIRVHSEMGLQILTLRTPEEPTPECLALPQNAAKNTSDPKNTSTTTTTTMTNNDNTKQQDDGNNGTAKATTNSTTSTTTLNLNMTAAELRRRLAERKKQDSRRAGGTGDGSLDFRKKYEIVDKL